MMRQIILTLLLVFLVAACAAPQQASPLPTEAASEAPTVVVETPQPESTVVEAQQQPQAVPTSRGDALVASDPAQVNLASGRPVLVEFFRFT